MLLGIGNRAGAGIMLAVLGSTDWVDGYIARHYDQGSELGKVLDPTADRLLFLVGVIAMLVDGSLELWFGVAMLVREGGVALMFLVLGALGATRVDVTWWGKTGTFGLMIALPLFLLGHSSVGWADGALVAAWVIGIPSLVISYYAAALYVPLGLAALREGRAARATEIPS